jgi:hypothetical protein
MNCVWRENDSRGRIIKEIRGKNKSSDSVICTGSEEASSIWRPKIDETAWSTRSARPTSIPLCTLEIVDFCLPIDSTCLHIISWASVLKLDFTNSRLFHGAAICISGRGDDLWSSGFQIHIAYFCVISSRTSS